MNKIRKIVQYRFLLKSCLLKPNMKARLLQVTYFLSYLKFKHLDPRNFLRKINIPYHYFIFLLNLTHPSSLTILLLFFCFVENYDSGINDSFSVKITSLHRRSQSGKSLFRKVGKSTYEQNSMFAKTCNSIS